jgi:hypothetical protein
MRVPHSGTAYEAREATRLQERIAALHASSGTHGVHPVRSGSVLLALGRYVGSARVIQRFSLIAAPVRECLNLDPCIGFTASCSEACICCERTW